MTGHATLPGWREQLVTCDVLPDELGAPYRLYASAVNAQAAERCRSAVQAVSAAEEAAEELSRVEPLLAQSCWTAPGLAFACHKGLWTGTPEPAQADSLVAQLAGTLRPHPPPMKFGVEDGDYAWVRYALDVFEGDLRRDRNDGEHIAPTTVRPADLSTLADALSLLRQSWPEMSQLIDMVVRQIVWFDEVNDGTGPRTTIGVRSATEAKTFGAIYLGTGGDRLRLMEALVHEATHHDVIMRLSADPLIFNGGHHGMSPFRRRGRPLTRVLHATVVAARVSMAYRRCGRSASRDDQVRCRQAAHLADASLRQGLLVGLQDAQWTPAGAILADALLAYANSAGDSRSG